MLELLKLNKIVSTMHKKKYKINSRNQYLNNHKKKALECHLYFELTIKFSIRIKSPRIKMIMKKKKNKIKKNYKSANSTSIQSNGH